MIEKLEPIKSFDCSDTPQAKMQHHSYHNDCINKINELCDIINTIQKEREAEWFEIKEWICILEAVRKSVNIHEKHIDELQMKLEPEKCKTRPENVQSDTESRPENVLTKSLRMDKDFAEDECVRLQKELNYTRKALEITKNAINSAVDHNIINCVARGIDPRTDDTNVTLCNALEKITTLEQKD